MNFSTKKGTFEEGVPRAASRIPSISDRDKRIGGKLEESRVLKVERIAVCPVMVPEISVCPIPHSPFHMSTNSILQFDNIEPVRF